MGRSRGATVMAEEKENSPSTNFPITNTARPVWNLKPWIGSFLRRTVVY